MKPWTGVLVWSVLLGITSCYNLPIASQLPNKSFMSERASVPAGVCQDPPSTVTIPVGDYADFTSPNYPSNYKAFQRCSWNFQTDAGAQLWLSCDSVSMSWFASLYVIDQGKRHDKSCLFCGGSDTYHYMVRSNTTIVGLQNNLWITNKGFSCKITSLPKPKNDGCNCGVIKSNRIVGGTETAPNKYPWMVLLVRPAANSNFCGGSLITDEFVLTAAHCTNGQPASDIQIRLGIHDKLTTPPNDSLRRDVLQIIQHPSYRSSNNDNDVSLLRISAVDFSSHPNIRPICLPTGSDDYAIREAITAGWGTTTVGGSTSTVLMEVALPVIHPTKCFTYLGSRVTNTMLCAGSDGLDSCQGDSGGPLFLSEGSGYQVVIGVVSWGIGCGYPGYPGVYARVTVFTSWIESNVAGSTVCSKP